MSPIAGVVVSLSEQQGLQTFFAGQSQAMKRFEKHKARKKAQKKNKRKKLKEESRQRGGVLVAGQDTSHQV